MHVPHVEVERALWEGDIHFNYQPIVRLSDGKLQGYEALVRWKSFSVDEIIYAIETNGLVSVWIKCQIWEIIKVLEILPKDLFISFNVGPNALCEPALLKELEGFPYPSRLQLEILETVKLDLGTAAILDSLDTRMLIKADDIGLEFPWLDRLVGVYAKHFQGLKLCESLTRHLLTDRACRSATCHIIGMAIDNGLTTTAEWVHDPVQAKVLESFGCDCGQGELFGLGRALKPSV